MDLAGKKIVITGAGRGLGRAFAEACADAGAAAVVVADINEKWGRATVRALKGSGTAAHFVPVDLGKPASITEAGKKIRQRIRRVDGLVNNGAIATGIGGKSFEEIDIATWDRVMRVNVRGTWLMTRACAPMLRLAAADAGGAAIVNIASDTALWGAPKLLHYVSSKGAVISMTRSLARELGPDRIAVNAVAPGLTLVEATEYVPQERHDYYVQGRAIQREQHPEDITGSVLYLLSDGARFVTGQVLPVNGGIVFN